ncbi:MAG: hypothetical protein HGB28_01535, partial [Oscillochloris sp.]|nr:hypothetical protein [Oscillochloris sp.]
MTNHNPARAKADSPVAHHGEETDVKLAPAGARTPKDPSAFWLPLEVALLACFLVVGIQTLLIKHFAVNVPYWDEWSNFRLLQLYNDGTLTLQYLFLPHNEHRIFFPRLVSIGLYVLVGENHPVAQMLLSALIMGLCAGVWAFTLVRLKVSPWVALLASLALTSPAQWENILNGFQTCFWMMDCSAVLAICFVSLPVRVSWGTVAACAVACFVSTFSLASGLVSWGACGAILALRLWLDA